MLTRLPTLPCNRRQCLAAAALALAAGSSHAGLFDALKPADKPLVIEDSSNFKELAATAFGKMAAKEWRSAPRRVAISSFRIRYVTDNFLSQNKGDRRAAASYKLKVPPVEVFEAITEKARAALVEALKAKGYEVLPPEALLADAEFAAKAAEAAAQAKAQDSSFFSKNGYVQVVAKGTADTWGVFQGAGDMKLAGRLGDDVALVRVSLQLNFASLEEMGWLERAGGAGVKGQAGLALDGGQPTVSAAQLATPIGLYDFPLRKTLYMTQPFAKAVDKVALSGTEVATGVLKSLMGGGSSSVAYEVTPADDYADQVSAALAQADRVLAELFAPAP